MLSSNSEDNSRRRMCGADMLPSQVDVIQVGLVGTGYAAKLRAEALQQDARSRLIAVAGHTPEKTQAFGQTYGAEPIAAWEDLVTRSPVDLVIIATVNRDHAAIARAALQAGKHVVVEYPLALDLAEAQVLVELATAQGRVLHVEHVELLSGVHQAVRTVLPAIGTPFHVRYTSFNPQRPAPQKWTYSPELFGFPLVGAVSRLHRLTDWFGSVASISCQSRFWGGEAATSRYTACICTAQLQFTSGLIAEVSYGKGEAIWQAARTLEIQGEQGAILVNGEQGTLVLADQTQAIELGSRRGLFARDTRMVLDHLLTGSPLYVSLASSLYALQVAVAAQQSARTQQTVRLPL